MIKAACHCTAVRLEIEKPEWVLDCNCTLCRRYGSLWAYYKKPGQVVLVSGADATDTYVWGDKQIAFHRCKECGCLMYMTALDRDPPPIFGVNARMIPTLDPKQVPLRQIDNGHTGFFWTHATVPPLTSRHPKMPAPGPDDWR